MEEFEPVLSFSSENPVPLISETEVREWYEIQGLFRSKHDGKHVRRSELEKAGVRRLRVATPYLTCEIDLCSGDMRASTGACSRSE
jgi:hypothetical protein